MKRIGVVAVAVVAVAVLAGPPEGMQWETADPSEDRRGGGEWRWAGDH